MTQMHTEFNSDFQAANELTLNYFRHYASEMTWQQRLSEAFSETGWSKAELSRRAGVSYDNVIKYLAGAVDQPRGDTLQKLATALGRNEVWLKDINPFDGAWGSVPITGYVGAGATVYFYAEPQSELERVPAPKSPNTAALLIKGRSLGPFYDTWLVYYDEARGPVTPDMISRDMSGPLCVVGLGDRVLLRKIMKSKEPGLFHLMGEDPILDVEIAWAARVRGIEPR